MKRKTLISLLLSAMMVLTVFTGCGGGKATSDAGDSAPAASPADAGTASTDGEASGDVVTLRYPTYRVGAHLGAKAEQAALERFNEKYGDKIKLEIEELPSDPAYTDKMKLLAATNELPDLVDGKNGVKDLAIKNGQAVDLREMLDADPDFRDNVIGATCIAANTEETGEIYSVYWGVQAVGYFYNKEMFQAAGIEPAKTWDEFYSNCDKLLAAGHTPMALMTGENSWTTNLLLAAMVASKGDAGNKLI